MILTSISIRVRYGETDQMGIVHHGNYPAYCEVARIEFFRKINLPYKDMEENGIILPVTELSLKFHKSAYFDDLLTVQTRLKEIPGGVRIKLYYSIFNENGDLLTTADTTLAFLDKITRKPIRCPEFIIQRLKEVEEIQLQEKRLD
ncbi:MAG: thioesterase family protein [Weeksellaceae bacterium]